MTGRQLSYGRQCVEEDDIAAVAAVLRSDFLTTGPATAEFEQALAARVGAAEAVSCSSGTAGLHLAALALDLAPEDVVVVPSMTFMATANAVRMAGGEVLFADVDPDSGLMRAEHLHRALDMAGARRVRAVFPVHLNGQAVDMAELGEAAGETGLTFVEDAAHAIGTVVHRGDAGSFPVGSCRDAAMTVFSFHPVKTMTMGEGGAVTTNDRDLAVRLRRLRGHGITRESATFVDREAGFNALGDANPWYHEMHEPGLNYRPSDIHCALGLSQLKKLDRLVAERRALVACYDTLLSELAPLVRPVARGAGCDPAWHLYAVLIDFASLGLDRAQVMRRLRERGIVTQVHYIPVHRQPYYRRRYGNADLPGADAYYARVLSLPLFAGMAKEDVERVAQALTAIVRGA